MKRRKRDPESMLESLIDAIGRDRDEAIHQEVVETFEGLNVRKKVNGFHVWDRWGDQEEPVLNLPERGRRYCRGCGVKKRTKSFDAVDGKMSERCRACTGEPKAVAGAA